MTGDELNTIAWALFDRYPQRYKEILYGMAETSDLGLDKVLLVNALEWFPKINKLSYEEMFRHSGLGAHVPRARSYSEEMTMTIQPT